MSERGTGKIIHKTKRRNGERARCLFGFVKGRKKRWWKTEEKRKKCIANIIWFTIWCRCYLVTNCHAKKKKKRSSAYMLNKAWLLLRHVMPSLTTPCFLLKLFQLSNWYNVFRNSNIVNRILHSCFISDKIYETRQRLVKTLYNRFGVLISYTVSVLDLYPSKDSKDIGRIHTIGCGNTFIWVFSHVKGILHLQYSTQLNLGKRRVSPLQF